MKSILKSLAIFTLFFPQLVLAATLPSDYPRLANYFLKWSISDQEALSLAKWDLLILDMETAVNSRSQLLKIRELNPQAIILAYITSQEIVDQPELYNQADWRENLDAGLHSGWWLRDSAGKRISNWPGTYMLNVSDGALPNSAGTRFNDYLPRFVNDNIKASGFFDGVFYDNLWGDISWLNGGNLDLDNDGRQDGAAQADALWRQGVLKILDNTKSLAGNDFIIMGNGRIYNGYQGKLNGMMLEDFPSAWESNGDWSGSVSKYLLFQDSSLSPRVNTINVTDKDPENYRHLRFGLASALLGDGFFSFDYDITNHGQAWWYDEYEVSLGSAQSPAYNLLSSSSEIRAGLWRRDFKYGSVLVNSTDKEQLYIFRQEELERIKGAQDPAVNSGARLSYIKLAPQDGIILWKKNTKIENSSFVNGYFYRVFNFSGQEKRNGFFAYISAFPGGASVIEASGSRIGEKTVSLVADKGNLKLYQNGQALISLHPFTSAFKKGLNLAAESRGGYIDRVALGAGPGGGPQVMVYTLDGKLRASFFAYDKYSRGGVNVALCDLDGDGEGEIITGPGKGQAPLVKVFSLSGKLEQSFLAYHQKFLGGVSVACGDVNADGRQEIITGAGPGGGPHVRIFSSSGLAIGGFFAYDQSYRSGLSVSASDIDGDGQAEILAGIRNF